MKAFFSILFGGLLILFLIIGIFSFGTVVWSSLGHHRNTALVADAQSVDPANNFGYIPSPTTPRYSAEQEEDVINAAAGALPRGDVKQVSAEAYLVKDLTTGAVVIEHHVDQLLPIASLTKLVTAVVARRSIPDTAHITITKSVMSTYGNTADFTAGETFSGGDLLYPMLMVSSNDAAEAYAEYYGKTKFIQAMNDFTQSIGAYRTSFSDSSGLDPRNVSTANDQAIIIDWIRKNDPAILAVTELKAYTVRSHTWINPTHFLSWSYYIGGKNGYLPEANRTNDSLFKWGTNGDTYVVVVLGSNDRDADTIALLKKIKP